MDIAQTITQRAKERGIDPELALSIAKAESGLRPDAKNPKSSARGLFQIVDDTWKQYGGDPKKRNDVNENIRVGLEIIADNQNDLKTTFGRAPRPAEVYAAHFFGKEGAKKVIAANPDAPVSSVVSQRVLKANPELLKGKTVFQALDALGQKVGDSSSGQPVKRAPAPKTAPSISKEDPNKPPVISDATQTLQRFGPGYQAALALSYLSDTQEESDDPDAPSIVEREAQAEIEEQTAAAVAPSGPRAADMLAGMDFGYQPVVAQPKQPVRLAEGGEVTDPEAQLIMGAERKEVSPLQFGRGMFDTAAGMLKGSAQAAAGLPGDIESLGRMAVGASPKTVLPTTDDTKAFIDRYAPLNAPADAGTGGRTAAEYFGEFMSPAGATRPVVRGAQALGAGVMEGAQRAEKALDPVVTRTMERGGKAAELLQALSPAPAQAMPGKVGAQAPAAKPSVFTPLPTPDAPFVGRLDKFAAEMSGPMKKEQLLGTLKGKFKDYEIERARVALEDLPDDAKVMSTDFLNRLNNVYNPSGYKTTVIEPQQGSFYQSVDNVFVEGSKTPPMGVIHLTQSVDAEVAKNMAVVTDAANALYGLSRADVSPEKLNSVLSWAKTQPDAPHIERLLTEGPVARAAKLLESRAKFEEMARKVTMPSISPESMAVGEKYMELSRSGAKIDNIYDKYKAEKAAATESAYQRGLQMAQELGVADQLPPRPRNAFGFPVALDDLSEQKDYVKFINDISFSGKERLRGMAHDELFPVQEELSLLRERIDNAKPYTGQHTALKNPPMPIAFSRFTERTANIPGMGQAKGIYVHELQSDLLDDLRKKGTKGGSTNKDYAELKDIETKLRDRYGMPDSEVFSLMGRQKVLESRLNNSSSSQYSIDEAMPNMEQSPQVVQQLMVKNAVNAAVQRGDQFVAFPGKESAQAQLYEKLPRNLDSVVKDLGPGFTKQSIEMPLPSGETAMFNAIVWSPEAAQKLQKSGIPFAKGGMVERNNHDNRSYK